jgi:hypothetical protein
VYSLTSEGKRMLVTDTREWKIYSRAVEGILEASHA